MSAEPRAYQRSDLDQVGGLRDWRRASWPLWARWNDELDQRYTLGVEEELMLLEPVDWSLAQSSDEVLSRLSDELSPHTFPETHAAVVELTTGIHPDVDGVVAELARLRNRLAGELGAMGLSLAAAGMHPFTVRDETEVSGAARYRVLTDSLRVLARREPTMALHVHVGVPVPEDAIRVLNGLRRNIPVLLALSANSPFWQGRDSGFASARTVIFQAFPRAGLPSFFADYADYVEAVDALIAPGAIPDPSFLWWDVRLQPTLGTVEVRVMDAHRVRDVAPLVALIQSLASHELEGKRSSVMPSPEILAENRFLAAREGMDARLIDSEARCLVPVREILDCLLADCREAAVALGCAGALDRVWRLAARKRRRVSAGARRRRRGSGPLGREPRSPVPRAAVAHRDRDGKAAHISHPDRKERHMCRWLAYSGSPILMNEALYGGTHSLVDQSLHSRLGAETTNGDGFGVGWYGDAPIPGVFHSVEPAWNDQNLRELTGHISSRLFFTHIRAAIGSAVQQTNCHPFRHDRWLFMHNGYINEFATIKRDLILAVDPSLYPEIRGQADTEVLFFLALTFGLEHDPPAAVEQAIGLVEAVADSHGVPHPFQGTVATTDGESIWAFRYSSERNSRSLFYTTDVPTLREQQPERQLLREFSDDARLIVSEPLGDVAGVWNEVPESTSCHVASDHAELRPFRPKAPARSVPVVA